MRTRHMKVAIVALLGAILIVGSFATDNFGISKAYVGWTNLPLLTIDGFTVLFYDLGSEIAPHTPYPNHYGHIYDEAGPDTAITKIIALFALALICASLLCTKRKVVFQNQPPEALSAPWKSPFKKHKYTAIPSLKRHPLHGNHKTQ